MNLSAVDVWLRATYSRVVGLARQLTRSEAILLGTLIIYVIAGTFGALAGYSSPWVLLATSAALAVSVVPPVIADALIARDNLARAREATVRINAAKPTGAPRVAEVTCKHGDAHRFVYGPSGWEAAGPAVERRPAPEEVSHP